MDGFDGGGEYKDGGLAFLPLCKLVLTNITHGTDNPISMTSSVELSHVSR